MGSEAQLCGVGSLVDPSEWCNEHCHNKESLRALWTPNIAHTGTLLLVPRILTFILYFWTYTRFTHLHLSALVHLTSRDIYFKSASVIGHHHIHIFAVLLLSEKPEEPHCKSSWKATPLPAMTLCRGSPVQWAVDREVAGKGTVRPPSSARTAWCTEVTP